jgi:3,4-dihydroxy 2-butanone 4-phosphate synthase/GTP cyclohydrolase II
VTALLAVKLTTDTGLSAAAAALGAGRPVLLCDIANGEATGNIVLAAALAEPRWTAWTVRRTSGFLCAPLPAALADELDVPSMIRPDKTSVDTDYGVAVDAASGVTTGISAIDRARTARVIADPTSTPTDLVRPGHLVPIRTRRGGVIEQPRFPEAAVDLCRLAGLPPVALVGTIVTDDGQMAPAHKVAELGAHHGHPVIGVDDLITHRLFHGDGVVPRVTRGTITQLPTVDGQYDAIGFHDEITGAEHVVLRGHGTPANPRISVHRECLAGDVFGALSCSCRRQLADAVARTVSDGGLLVYLRRPTCQYLADKPDPHAWTPADDGAVAAILTDLGVQADGSPFETRRIISS